MYVYIYTCVCTYFCSTVHDGHQWTKSLHVVVGDLNRMHVGQSCSHLLQHDQHPEKSENMTLTTWGRNGGSREFHKMVATCTWWLIPLSKWVITKF